MKNSHITLDAETGLPVAHVAITSPFAGFRSKFQSAFARIFALSLLLGFACLHARADYSGVITADGSNNIVFSPGVVVAVLVGVAVAAAGAGATLVVLGMGFAWLLKMIKRAKG